MRKDEAERGIYGLCSQHGRHFVISLSLRRCRTVTEACETLLHEWAHACSTRHDKIERLRRDHDIHFDVTYGKIYRHFTDDGGREESGNYPWKK
jgi:hypothetical protein